MNFDKNLIGGSSDMLILSLLRGQDCYGYEIIRELKSRSDNSFEFKEGTLYPILHKLEGRGLVRAYEAVSESGRKRTYYAITESGGGYLDEELNKWREFSRSVDMVIGGSPVTA